MARAAEHAHGGAWHSVAGRGPGRGRLADDGPHHHVDRVSQEDHLARHPLLALLIRRPVHPSTGSLHMAIGALDTERLVEGIHGLKDLRRWCVLREDLEICHGWHLLAAAARRLRHSGYDQEQKDPEPDNHV